MKQQKIIVSPTVLQVVSGPKNIELLNQFIQAVFVNRQKKKNNKGNIETKINQKEPQNKSPTTVCELL